MLFLFKSCPKCRECYIILCNHAVKCCQCCTVLCKPVVQCREYCVILCKHVVQCRDTLTSSSCLLLCLLSATINLRKRELKKLTHFFLAGTRGKKTPPPTHPLPLLTQPASCLIHYPGDAKLMSMSLYAVYLTLVQVINVGCTTP